MDKYKHNKMLKFFISSNFKLNVDVNGTLQIAVNSLRQRYSAFFLWMFYKLPTFMALK